MSCLIHIVVAPAAKAKRLCWVQGLLPCEATLRPKPQPLNPEPHQASVYQALGFRVYHSSRFRGAPKVHTILLLGPSGPPDKVCSGSAQGSTTQGEFWVSVLGPI